MIPCNGFRMAILTRLYTPFFSLVVYFIFRFHHSLLNKHYKKTPISNHACGLTPPVLIIL
jgi:hypothetical protein